LSETISTPTSLIGTAGHHSSALTGNERVLKLLLERADINPYTANDDGETPVAVAIWMGHEGVVKMLLE